MDSIEKDLEAQLQDSGFEISNDAPEGFESAAQENVAPATALEGIEPDFDLSVSNETDTQTATATEPQATEQAAVESSLDTETAVEPEQDVNIDEVVLGYLSETLGVNLNSLDDLRSSMTQQQAEIDERVKVIADFVEKTGRSPEDWFKYQAINPSEMDDLTGEEVVAFVRPHPGQAVGPEELDSLCLDNIARFKRPKAYLLVDDLPKNNYGKILKTELRKLAVPAAD